MKGRDYHWFRYPFLVEGNTQEKRDQIREFLAKNDYKIAQVSIDFEDWAWNDSYARCVEKANHRNIEWLKQSYIESATEQLKIASQLSQILFGREMKHILLLHIGVFDALMLDELLAAYEKAGTRFITLQEASSDPAYRSNPNILMRHGWTYLDQLMEAKKLKYPPSPLKLPLDRLDQICR